MSRLAPRAGTWAQPVIPPGQPVVSIPHGKLASATETSFWRDSIFLGESGNIHRVLLSPPRSFFEVKGKSEKEKDGIKEEIIGWTFTEEQQKIILPQDGLVLSTLCDGKLQKHLHLEYRGQQGVRLQSDQFPMVPPEADGEGHWPRIQVVVYPYEGRCTFTFYDGEGTKHWVDTSINLGMEYITSCNIHHFQNFPDPSIGLLYEKSLDRELFSSMILRPTTSGCNFSEDDVIHSYTNMGKSVCTFPGSRRALTLHQSQIKGCSKAKMLL